MKSFTILTVCLLLSIPLTAQYVWNGSGDGTSWEDAMNWVQGEVPATDSIVSFPIDATVTGVAPNIPVGLRIGNRANVILDLDLIVGNGNTAEHAITFGDSCSLTLGVNGSSRTLISNTKNNKHALAIFGGSEMAAFTINEGCSFQVLSGVTGINLANAASTITNNGTITVGSGVKDGFRIVGSFVNNGIVIGGAVERDLFNIKDGGVLTNTTTGMIISDQPGDDGIDLINGASFVNDGELQMTAKDNASSGNNTINVGNPTTVGTFINNSNNVFLDGGGGSGDLVGRTLTVDTLGVLTNNGIITLSGGDSGSRLHVKGAAENALNGIIDLTDGRFNTNNGGTFVNNGLIKSTRDGSGGFVTGTAINNGFFDYASSNSFAAGSMGTIIEKGISLNNNDTIINARNQCVVDVANVAYEWFLNGVAYATASDTGALAFAPASLSVDSILLTTTIPGVSISVRNICDEAVETLGIFSPAIQAEPVASYPNPVIQGQALTLDLSAMPTTPLKFQVFNAYGQSIAEHRFMGGSLAKINTSNWRAGTYVISSVVASRVVLSRVVVTGRL